MLIFDEICSFRGSADFTPTICCNVIVPSRALHKLVNINHLLSPPIQLAQWTLLKGLLMPKPVFVGKLVLIGKIGSCLL